MIITNPKTTSMKKLALIVVFLLFCVAACFFNDKKSPVEQVQTKQEEEVVKLNIEPEEESLISKVYDDFNEQTKVSYIGKAKKQNFYMSASYYINNNDILKNKLPTPKADDFRICIIASHKGARDVSRVEMTINKSMYVLRPNYTKYEGNGKFTMLFNFGRMLDNLNYPKYIAFADRLEARVIFDNGSETCELSKDDLKSVSVIYKSYINDGGKFE